MTENSGAPCDDRPVIDHWQHPTGSSSPDTTSDSTRPTARVFWTIIVTFVLATMLCTVAMLAAQSLSGIDPAALTLTQFGPALGALATWLSWRKVIAPLLPAPAPLPKVRANLGSLVAVCVLLGLLVAAAMTLTGHDLVGPAAVGGVPFAVFVAVQLLGATGEEIGWRGFMQPLLESRVRRYTAIIVTGAVWALWHVPSYSHGLVTGVSFFVAAVAFAVILGTLTIGSYWQRVAVAAVGHWLINVGLYLSVGDATLGRPQVVFMALAAVFVAGGVVAVREWRRR
ncbi:CPBP family intramembrane glutamic endopeptidase [Nocardia sp. NPDC049149]|uniref:CPBP family intramembrane glutamic endopeptidase n=1 Tax=Nocardia sp. NPDC049149 TaxID=3364315 RepID=UPI003711D5DE